MGGYDDARISDSHRRALEAGLDLLRRHPELRDKAFEVALRAAFGKEDCGKLQSEADHLFELARQAYEMGDPKSGHTWMLLAADALDRYHECLLHDSLAPPDEFLPG